jgi:hypothetical protein
MKKYFSIVLSLNLVILTGCSAFMPKSQTVSVACSESDAALQINGQQFNGAAQTDVPRNKSVNIMCTKPGYFPAQRSIDYSLSGTGVADIVGTVLFILPGIGLFTDGAWSLDETNVNVSMVPNEMQSEYGPRVGQLER